MVDEGSRQNETVERTGVFLRTRLDILLDDMENNVAISLVTGNYDRVEETRDQIIQLFHTGAAPTPGDWFQTIAREERE